MYKKDAVFWRGCKELQKQMPLRRKKIESEKVFPLFFPICDISRVLD